MCFLEEKKNGEGFVCYCFCCWYGIFVGFCLFFVGWLFFVLFFVLVVLVVLCFVVVANWMHHKVTTGPDDAVATSSSNGLVGIGFASRYMLQASVVCFKMQSVGVKSLHLLSH